MRDDIIGGVIVAVVCVFMIGLLLMVAHNNTVDVYTYKTVSGETGEANTCSDYYGSLVCRTADGRTIRVESYILKQRGVEDE